MPAFYHRLSFADRCDQFSWYTIFGGSLILLLVLLGLSLREIQVSIDALTLQIADLDEIDLQIILEARCVRGCYDR
jgi:hypothetical protein